MSDFLTAVFVFAFVAVVGPAYAAGVHRLGAWITRKLPPKAVRLLTKRLWRTEWDRARPRDLIALEAEDKLNKQFVR